MRVEKRGRRIFYRELKYLSWVYKDERNFVRLIFVYFDLIIGQDIYM